MNRTRNFWLPLFIVTALALSVAGCDSTNKGDEPDIVSAPQPLGTADRILPTIYPTATMLPVATATTTLTPEPTLPPDTPVSFDQVAVDLRYSIPAIGLDRRIQANVANQIEITDMTTGESVVRKDQPGILLELQQAFTGLILNDVPDGCDRCVQIEYEIPLSETSGSGWLEDVRLLASMENYTSVVLGPYFPPETIAALHRSATPFQAAHTVAVSGDGTLWIWKVAEAEIESPQAIDVFELGLVESLSAIEDSTALEDSYMASCLSSPGRETLFIGGEEPRTVNFSCPELAMPSNLVSLYQILDGLAADSLAAEADDRPDPPLPLESLLYYQREDGYYMTTFQDGRAITIDTDGQAYTGTITSTLAISLTSELVDTGLFVQGAEALGAGRSGNILVVRTDQGIFEASWQNEAETNLSNLVGRLDELMDDIVALFELDEATANGSQTPNPTFEATQTP